MSWVGYCHSLLSLVTWHNHTLVAKLLRSVRPHQTWTKTQSPLTRARVRVRVSRAKVKGILRTPRLRMWTKLHRKVSVYAEVETRPQYCSLYPVRIMLTYLTTVFHLFPKLPIELRLRIWEAATMTPRVVQVNHYSLWTAQDGMLPEVASATNREEKYNRLLSMTRHNCLISTLFANSESYRTVSALYRKVPIIFWNSENDEQEMQDETFLYVNLNIDTVMIWTRALKSRSHFATILGTLSGLRHSAITYP